MPAPVYHSCTVLLYVSNYYTVRIKIFSLLLVFVFYVLFVRKGGFQVVLMVKNPPANAGDARDIGSIPG